MNQKYEQVDVLIVEDETTLSEILSKKFNNMNISNKIADNGRIALDLCASVRPRVILLDIMMPELDGFAFLKQLLSRTTDVTQRRPYVIVMSNLSEPDKVSQMLVAGATEYLVKADTPLQSIVDKLGHFVSLDVGCGYIEVVNMGSISSPQWTLFDVFYGMPFFDSQQ